MKKAFISFAEGEMYENLADCLKQSINIHSKYNLVVYNQNDFNVKYNLKSPEGFAYKILSCLKALEVYDEIVWIDCDSIVTRNIDKIWFESYRLKNYPLIPLNRFSNFDENFIYQKKYTSINSESLEYFNINSNNHVYKQCCLMYLNRKSIDFLKLVLSYFSEKNFSQIFPFGDETIINCLLIKYDYNDDLGDIFICSHYFHNILGDYLKIDNRYDYAKLFSQFNINKNNYENILFLHGSKDSFLHNSLINKMQVKNIYSDIKKNRIIKSNKDFKYSLSFNDGPRFETKNNILDNWKVQFLDDKKVCYETVLKNNMWSVVHKKYFVNWRVIATNQDNVYLDYRLNLNNKNVLINIKSASLGDNLAWIPYVEEFRKKHKCNVFCSSDFYYLFKNQYENINFTNEIDYEPDFFATYDIGYFINNENKVKQDVRGMSLQKIACDILDLEYKEIKPKLKLNKNKQKSEKSVCIAIQSTSQCKYWNNDTGWVKTIEYLNKLGYKVYCIDRHYSYGNNQKINIIPNNAIDKTGDYTLQERIDQICEADFFIGLGSGLSWLAWACEKPVIMISGFSDPIAEFSNPYRVHNKNVCNSCWNDSSVEFDKGNWMWCPRNKDFECSKQITFDMVKEKIDQVINDLKMLS